MISILMFLQILTTPIEHSLTALCEFEKVDTDVVKIREDIVRLQPIYSKNKERAHLVATAIVESSKNNDIDSEIYLAILFKESSLLTDPQNCLKEAKSCTGDYGMSQVNYRTWGKVLNIDKAKMLTDVAYSIEVGARVLSYYKRYENKDSIWYARYHSKTPRLKKMYAHQLHKIMGIEELVAQF